MGQWGSLYWNKGGLEPTETVQIAQSAGPNPDVQMSPSWPRSLGQGPKAKPQLAHPNSSQDLLLGVGEVVQGLKHWPGLWLATRTSYGPQSSARYDP